jgi:GT2 family glycosyltransferase
MPAPARTPGNGAVGVVIVAYNDPGLLSRCIAALRAGSYRDVEIVVVDNSTMAEASDEIRSWPGIHYLKTPENLGFCGANNMGIRKAVELGSEFLLLLNHDAILDARCLETLVGRAGTLAAPAVLTGKIYLTAGDRMLWYAGGYFSRWIGAGKNHGFNEKDVGQYDSFKAVDYATGCCMLIPVPIYLAVGGLNERFFMYLDDIEYCLRVIAAGFRIYYEPAAIIHHDLGSGSELRKRPDYYLYFSIRNKPLVVRGRAYTAWLYAAMTAVAAVKFLQFMIVPGIAARPSKLKAIALGFVDGFSSRSRYKERFPRLFGTRR